MKRYTKGFTLIELLVVIAIIGILASVVLVSLGSARNKGKSASAIGSLSSARAQAELGVNASGQYVAGICTSTGTGGLGGLIAAAEAQLDGELATASGDPVDCWANSATVPTAWAVEAILNDGAGYYCVDSTGFAGQNASRYDIAADDFTCAAN